MANVRWQHDGHFQARKGVDRAVVGGIAGMWMLQRYFSTRLLVLDLTLGDALRAGVGEAALGPRTAALPRFAAWGERNIPAAA